eukprot:766170-Hanusia_phi.AAC.2
MEGDAVVDQAHLRDSGPNKCEEGVEIRKHDREIQGRESELRQGETWGRIDSWEGDGTGLDALTIPTGDPGGRFRSQAASPRSVHQVPQQHLSVGSDKMLTRRVIAAAVSVRACLAPTDRTDSVYPGRVSRGYP